MPRGRNIATTGRGQHINLKGVEDELPDIDNFFDYISALYRNAQLLFSTHTTFTDEVAANASLNSPITRFLLVPGANSLPQPGAASAFTITLLPFRTSEMSLVVSDISDANISDQFQCPISTLQEDSGGWQPFTTTRQPIKPIAIDIDRGREHLLLNVEIDGLTYTTELTLALNSFVYIHVESYGFSVYTQSPYKHIELAFHKTMQIDCAAPNPTSSIHNSIGTYTILTILHTRVESPGPDYTQRFHIGSTLPFAQIDAHDALLTVVKAVARHSLDDHYAEAMHGDSTLLAPLATLTQSVLALTSRVPMYEREHVQFTSGVNFVTAAERLWSRRLESNPAGGMSSSYVWPGLRYVGKPVDYGATYFSTTHTSGSCQVSIGDSSLHPGHSSHDEVTLQFTYDQDFDDSDYRVYRARYTNFRQFGDDNFFNNTFPVYTSGSFSTQSVSAMNSFSAVHCQGTLTFIKGNTTVEKDFDTTIPIQLVRDGDTYRGNWVAQIGTVSLPRSNFSLPSNDMWFTCWTDGTVEHDNRFPFITDKLDFGLYTDPPRLKYLAAIPLIFDAPDELLAVSDILVTGALDFSLDLDFAPQFQPQPPFISSTENALAALTLQNSIKLSIIGMDLTIIDNRIDAMESNTRPNIFQFLGGIALTASMFMPMGKVMLATMLAGYSLETVGDVMANDFVTIGANTLALVATLIAHHRMSGGVFHRDDVLSTQLPFFEHPDLPQIENTTRFRTLKENASLNSDQFGALTRPLGDTTFSEPFVAVRTSRIGVLPTPDHSLLPASFVDAAGLLEKRSLYPEHHQLHVNTLQLYETEGEVKAVNVLTVLGVSDGPQRFNGVFPSASGFGHTPSEPGVFTLLHSGTSQSSVIPLESLSGATPEQILRDYRAKCLSIGKSYIDTENADLDTLRRWYLGSNPARPLHTHLPTFTGTAKSAQVNIPIELVEQITASMADHNAFGKPYKYNLTNNNCKHFADSMFSMIAYGERDEMNAAFLSRLSSTRFNPGVITEFELIQYLDDININTINTVKPGGPIIYTREGWL
ncbi:hypothetical protein [Wenling crustacean virus 1]|uniref:hypothetical protein n=1 Tax=Wenling crustacean virus 1 TaxID=1923478 RepID=UPI00090BDC7D|nr:hypothetical protein [Wenling crustacean virus 1]APG77809.1 hypothetical protein [Wenling crustacean virus 1]